MKRPDPPSPLRSRSLLHSRSPHRHRRLVLGGSLVAVLVAGLVGLTVPASAASSPSCDATWGSLDRATPDPSPGTDFLTDVRAGQHPCYDRLVVDLAGDTQGFAGYDVGYGAVSTEGQGRPVPLRGAADLRIVVRAPAYDQAGRATFNPADPSEAVGVEGFRTFQQVAYAGSFEGQTTIGVGLRARLPFRVLVLAGSPDDPRGARLVVDVAHHW